jgi:hypothetical protein
VQACHCTYHDAALRMTSCLRLPLGCILIDSSWQLTGAPLLHEAGGADLLAPCMARIVSVSSSDIGTVLMSWTCIQSTVPRLQKSRQELQQSPRRHTVVQGSPAPFAFLSAPRCQLCSNLQCMLLRNPFPPQQPQVRCPWGSRAPGHTEGS